MAARPVGELEALARPYSIVSVPDDAGVPGVFAAVSIRKRGSEISVAFRQNELSDSLVEISSGSKHCEKLCIHWWKSFSMPLIEKLRSLFQGHLFI